MLGACQAAVLLAGRHPGRSPARQERRSDLSDRAGGGKCINAQFDIERGIHGESAEERLRVRQEQSAQLLAELKVWLREQRVRPSNPSAVAKPIDYMLRRWDRFGRLPHDGRTCLANNAVERALRGFALGRKSCRSQAPNAATTAPPSW